MKHFATSALLHRQQGLTMVELLVGLALSLALVAGITQMVVSTQQNSRLQINQATLVDNARFAMEFLSRSGQRAGYRNNRLFTLGTAFPANGGFVRGAVVTGTDTSFSVRYEGDPDATAPLANCLNQPANVAGVYIETWELNGTDLRCRRTNPAGAVATEPLLAGVEAINIRYGVDTGGDLAPDAYVTAAAVTDWTMVRSVNIRLRLVSDEDNLVETPTAFPNFAGGTTTPTDRRVRRILTTTIALRNILP